MRKLIFIFLLFALKSNGQVYQAMTQYGYDAKRMNFDSTLQIPTVCGVPTLKSVVGIKKAAIAFDSCNKRFYFYNPKTLAWDTIKGGSGGGGSTDTTSLSNRINLKLNISDTANKWVNNITRIVGKDSIIYFIGSNRYAIKDSVGTNPAPVGYYGAFSDNTSQTAAFINTAYAVKLNTTDLTNGVSVVNDGSGNPTKIRLANTGIYNIQFSLQLEKTGGSGNMIADIWIRKNSVDIPSTTGKVVLTGSANASPIIAAWNYVLDLAAGDSIQLMWATSNTNVEIIAAAASSPHPATPSAILTVTQQSGIMAGTGMTALNGLTGAVQTFAVDSTNSTFKITSSGTTHTFNIPNASASGVTRGLLSNTDYTTFNGKVPYTGATGDVNLNTHNIIVNNVDARTTTLTASNQTIQLTLDSSFIQLATGTTSNIFYNLPNATTLNVGASFQFNNNTTSGYISVRNFGVVNTIATIPAGGAVQVVLLSNTTTTGTWDVLNYGPKNTSWGTDSLIATSTKAKFSSLVLGIPLTVANGGADSTTYYTKYRSDTARTNIYNGISSKLNITDTSVFQRKADSTTYQTKYRSDTARTNIYSGISSKLTASDTSVFQRKSLPSYTFIANNTTGTANGTTQTFKDSGQKVYSGTVTWSGGTPPSGTSNNTYRWSQIGKLVTLRMNLSYSVAGATVTGAVCVLPSDVPAPELPTNFTATNAIIAFGAGGLGGSTTSYVITTTPPGTCTIRTAASGYEVVILRASGSWSTGWATIQYFAQ